MNFTQIFNTLDQLSEKVEQAISNTIFPIGYKLDIYISNMSPSGECDINSRALSYILAKVPWALQEQIQDDLHYAQNSTLVDIMYTDNGDIFIETANAENLIPFQKILEQHGISNKTKANMLKHFPALD